MSATMARQGIRVQLEQSDMRLVSNIATMANECFSSTAIEDRKYLIKKPCAKVREEKKRGVEFPVHKRVKAVIQWHPAMLRQNQKSGGHSCPNGTAENPQPPWWHTGTGTPPPARCREQTPELTPPLRGTPRAPTGHTSGAHPSQIDNLPVRYTYSHSALPCAECLNDDEDTQYDPDFDPDILTDDG